MINLLDELKNRLISSSFYEVKHILERNDDRFIGISLFEDPDISLNEVSPSPPNIGTKFNLFTPISPDKPIMCLYIATKLISRINLIRVVFKTFPFYNPAAPVNSTDFFVLYFNSTYFNTSLPIPLFNYSDLKSNLYYNSNIDFIPFEFEGKEYIFNSLNKNGTYSLEDIVLFLLNKIPTTIYDMKYYSVYNDINYYTGSFNGYLQIYEADSASANTKLNLLCRIKNNGNNDYTVEYNNTQNFYFIPNSSGLEVKVFTPENNILFVFSEDPLNNWRFI